VLPYAEPKNILKSVFGMASFFCEGGFFLKKRKKFSEKHFGTVLDFIIEIFNPKPSKT
jgi:hypothetical protein